MITPGPNMISGHWLSLQFHDDNDDNDDNDDGVIREKVKNGSLT